MSSITSATPPVRMPAAVVEAFGEKLVFKDFDVPTPGPDQILIKSEACGVCHTDVHAAKGNWPIKPALPFMPGHEAIGIVVAMGDSVTSIKMGERVGVPWLYSACGHCEYCLSDWEAACPEAQFSGFTHKSGFASYIIANPDYVAHIPADLHPTEAAPLICASVTTCKGIKETKARPGQWTVISGCGGLGHLDIQYAKAMGLKVCAVNIDDAKLAHAKCLEAEIIVNAKAADPVLVVKEVLTRLEAGDVPSRVAIEFP